MTDLIPDTPNMTRPFCPRCEPEADVLGEVLTVRFCVEHAPACEGPDDDRLRLSIQGHGGDTAEGRDCAEFAAWLAGRR